MRTTDEWLNAYGESHQNPTNKLIHWICVPPIMFSLIGIMWHVPPMDWLNGYGNLATLFVLITMVFYIRLSIRLFIGFIPIGIALLVGNAWLSGFSIGELSGRQTHLILSVAIFVIAWIGQFIGHKIEGKKPSFFEDLQFLLVGPAWLLHFIYKKLGLRY